MYPTYINANKFSQNYLHNSLYRQNSLNPLNPICGGENPFSDPDREFTNQLYPSMRTSTSQRYGALNPMMFTAIQLQTPVEPNFEKHWVGSIERVCVRMRKDGISSYKQKLCY